MRLGVALLDGIQEDAKEQRRSEDADGISDRRVVHGSAVGSLGVEELAEALIAQHEVGDGHGAHEGSGNGGDPVVLLLIEEVHGSGPQNDHGERLVGPAEVTPNNGVVDLAEGIADAEKGADAEHGDAEEQTVLPALLVHLEPVGQNQTGGAERGVAGGDGAGDDAEHGKGNADAAHGLGADVIHSGGAAAAESKQLFTGVESASGSRPDQGDDAFGDHRAVEDEVALLLALHAACHQGALRSMEAGDRAAGDGDEHEAPNRRALRMEVCEVAPNFGDGVALGEDAERNTERHNDQADAKHGVDLADDLIDGEEGRNEVIDQNQDQPEHLAGEDAFAAALGAEQLDEAGGADRKHGADHHEQHHAEYAHDVLHRAAEVDAGDLGDGSAFVALTHHTGEIVVDRTGKDGAEGDPQEHHGTPQSTLQSTKDGAQTCNVQQLDEEQLPLGHHNVVNAIVDAHSRSFAVVRSERVVHDLTIDKVAYDQKRQTQ